VKFVSTGKLTWHRRLAEYQEHQFIIELFLSESPASLRIRRTKTWLATKVVLLYATVRYQPLPFAMWRDWMKDLGDLVAMRSGARRVKGLDCQSVRGEKSTKKDLFVLSHNKSTEKSTLRVLGSVVSAYSVCLGRGWGLGPNDSRNFSRRALACATPVLGEEEEWSERIYSRPETCVRGTHVQEKQWMLLALVRVWERFE